MTFVGYTPVDLSRISVNSTKILKNCVKSPYRAGKIEMGNSEKKNKFVKGLKKQHEEY